MLIRAIQAPELLSLRAQRAMDDPANIREVSAISIVEIAIKAGIGKLALDPALVFQGAEDLLARIVPFGPHHARRLFTLPQHHRDPFDRQLIAQALEENIAIITPDNAFRLYKGLKVIW